MEQLNASRFGGSFGCSSGEIAVVNMRAAGAGETQEKGQPTRVQGWQLLGTDFLRRHTAAR